MNHQKKTQEKISVTLVRQSILRYNTKSVKEQTDKWNLTKIFLKDPVLQNTLLRK